jgi:hypothetical protein
MSEATMGGKASKRETWILASSLPSTKFKGVGSMQNAAGHWSLALLAAARRSKFDEHCNFCGEIAQCKLVISCLAVC